MKDGDIERAVARATKSNTILSLMPFLHFTSGPQKELVGIRTDEELNKLVVSFDEDTIDGLSGGQIEALAHHELYHAALHHKRLECKELCAVVAKEFDVNRWLSSDDLNHLSGAAQKAAEAGKEFGILDPRELATAIGLTENAIHTIPLEVLHEFLHVEMSGEGGGTQKGMGKPGTNGDQPCDGGQPGGDGQNEGGGDGSFASAMQAAIGALVQGELEDVIESTFGRGDAGSAISRINSTVQQPPPWLREVLEWCKKNILQPDWKNVRTHTRPHLTKRQAGIHSPTVKRRASWAVRSVVLGVDTSGSMVNALGPVEHVVRYLSMHGVDVRLICCDTKVTYDGPALPWKPPSGGGGTVLEPMAKRTRETEADGVIWFSDGYWEAVPDANRGRSQDSRLASQLYVVPKNTRLDKQDRIDWSV